MVEIKITTTCLANGMSDNVIAKYETVDEARNALELYLDKQSQGLFNKFLSAQRRVKRGTSKGIKIFYSPVRGIRHYLWIKVTQDIQL